MLTVSDNLTHLLCGFTFFLTWSYLYLFFTILRKWRLFPNLSTSLKHLCKLMAAQIQLIWFRRQLVLLKAIYIYKILYIYIYCLWRNHVSGRWLLDIMNSIHHLEIRKICKACQSTRGGENKSKKCSWNFSTHAVYLKKDVLYIILNIRVRSCTHTITELGTFGIF